MPRDERRPHSPRRHRAPEASRQARRSDRDHSQYHDNHEERHKPNKDEPGLRRGRSRSRSRSRSPRRDRSPVDRRRSRSRSVDARRKSRSRSRSPARKRRRSRSSSVDSRRHSRERRRSKSRSRSRSRSRDRGERRRKRDRSRSSSSDSEDDSRKRKEKRKRSKERRKEKKKEKKEKKEKKKHAASASSHWGKYGIITETDIFTKSAEFYTWLVEERKINPETISKDQSKKEFAKFVEDFNTATLPHEKYYHIEAYERRMTALRSGEFVPPPEDTYDAQADMKAINKAHKKKAVDHDSYLTKEQLMELRKVQHERIEAGKMKLLGMDIKQNMGVRMDGTSFE